MCILRAAYCLGTLLLLVPLAGCGGINVGEVKGTVTLDGEPIADGVIRFEAVDLSTPTAGDVIKNGQYSAKVPLGLMKVTINASKQVGTRKLYDTPDSPTMPISVERVPEKYNTHSELQFEVKPGVNEKNWNLTTN